MESEQRSDRNVWLEYIGKLIDRNLNKQRTSGFTIWALAGVISILLVKTLAYLPNITTNPTAVSLHLLAITGIFDLVFFTGNFLMVMLYIGSNAKESRLQSRLYRSLSPVIDWVSFSIFIVFGFLNLSTSLLAPTNIQIFPFITMGVVFFLSALIYLTSLISTLIKHKKYELPDLPELVTRVNLKGLVAGRIISFLLLLIALFPSIQAIPHITTPVHVNILIWSLYVAGIFFLSLLIFFKQYELRYDQFLTELEQRIVIETLPPDIIRSEFIKDILGEDVRLWITSVEKEMKRLLDEFDQTALKAEQQFIVLNKKNLGVKFERTGQREKICKMSWHAYSAYLKYFKGVSSQISIFYQKGIPKMYISSLEQIIADWNHSQHSILDRQKTICNICRN